MLIHITKTGGTSIRKGVWHRNYEKPVFGYMPDEWSHLFKFAFVRHPFDRVISAWKMFTEGAVGDKSWKFPADARPLTLSQFMDIVEDDSIIFDERRKTFEEKIRHHAIPQTHPFNCLKHADFVGRFERIDEDFAKIAARLGMTTKLPKMHHTTHTHWQDYFDDEILSRCRAFYAQDLEELNYRA